MQQVSGILDVAIGLVFIYLLLSLICSALTEAVESFLKLRGKKLCEGLIELFGGLGSDGKGSTFINSFYKNPLIYGLYKGDATITQNTKLNIPSNLPSYIAPNTFALALVNQIAGNTPITLDGLKQQIAQSNDIPESVKASLSTLIGTAGGSLEQAIANIENWYSNMGERVGGWYKRHAQYVALGVALVISVVGNVDTLTIARSLMVDSNLREQIASAAAEYAKLQPTETTEKKNQVNQLEAEIKQLEATGKEKEPDTANKRDELNALKAEIAKTTYEQQMQQISTLTKFGLPIGWQNTADQRILPPCSFLAWMEKIMGWFITTLTVSLGAPFWFDILNKFVNFRASIKPKPKKTE